jgi:hypothetical protein
MRGQALDALRRFARNQATDCYRRAKKSGAGLMCSKLTKKGVRWEKVARYGLDDKKQAAPVRG